MGCDIHLVLERKLGEGGWVGIHNFPYWQQRGKSGRNTAFPLARDRNYSRFAALAGVRGDGPAPRGVPEDVSVLAQVEIDRYGNDGHSHSWISIEEAAGVFAKTEWEYSKPDEWAAKYPACYFFGVEPEDTQDHRLIYWFDN